MLKRIILVLSAVLLFVACALAGAMYRFTHTTELAEEKTIYLPKGSGFKTIVRELDQKQVIPDPLSFAIPAVLLGKYKTFKPGEYEFPAGITPNAVMQILTEGKVVLHKLTIAEGLTSQEIVQKISAEPLLDGTLSTIPAEGALLPETYYFERGDSRESIVLRMQSGMRQLMAELWEKRASNLPFSTPEEAVTLASIVEKETGVAAERRRVAAVYINRLRQNIKLQADPTTIYAIQLAEGKPMTRALTKKDLERPLPHNTYANTGLPPTPIANPGRASIEAALNPLETKELFFVATGDGGHYFAETYAQHVENIQKYRSQLTANNASQPEIPAK